MMRSSAYNRFGVLMGASWPTSCPRWYGLREDSLPMITLFPSQGDFCATAVKQMRDHGLAPSKTGEDGGILPGFAANGISRRVRVHDPLLICDSIARTHRGRISLAISSSMCFNILWLEDYVPCGLCAIQRENCARIADAQWQ